MSQFKTIDAETLMTTFLPPTKFVVERLLPQGLHVLAGAPKVGKSWLALWLCLCVAKGEPVWDFRTNKGGVLYLCLEDSYARVQNRMFQITDSAPDTLHFANLAGSVGGGLEEQIKRFLKEVQPDTSLIVIDTLQKVRKQGDGANPHANDYRDLSALKRLADEHHIAILLIHHLRKMNDDDPLNMISGTTGISGATDSSFVLKEKKRGSHKAVLYCTGRDIEYMELSLCSEKELHFWQLTEPVEEEQVPVDPELVFLSDFLKQLKSFDGTATELAALLEEHTGEKLLPSVLSKRLVRYAADLDKAGIRIVSSRTRDSCQLHILCIGNDGNDGKMGRTPCQISCHSRHNCHRRYEACFRFWGDLHGFPRQAGETPAGA